MTQLTHLDADGRARMVDVGGKPETDREAVARGRFVTTPEVVRLVVADDLPKADVLATADISEYRIRQTELQSIVVELAAPETLSLAKIDAFRQLVRAYAGEGFDIEVRQVSEIDWGADTKRLGFRNELLS